MIDVFLVFLMMSCLCGTGLTLWFDSTFAVHFIRVVRWCMVKAGRTTYDAPMWQRNNSLPGEDMRIWTRLNLNEWIEERMFSIRPRTAHLMLCPICMGQRISIGVTLVIAAVMLTEWPASKSVLLLCFGSGTNVVAQLIWNLSKSKK